MKGKTAKLKDVQDDVDTFPESIKTKATFEVKKDPDSPEICIGVLHDKDVDLMVLYGTLNDIRYKYKNVGYWASRRLLTDSERQKIAEMSGVKESL